MAITEEKRAYNREYYKQNREKRIAYAKRNYEDNREARSAQRKEYHAANKGRRNAESRAWYQKNRLRIVERQRAHSHNYRFTRHGLTESKYLEMVEAQGGVCAVCRRECDVAGKLSIDHDHDSGRGRGLLCKRCNSGLGFFRESPDVLERALAYLKEQS